MRSILTLVLALILLVVIVLDGAGMFVAYNSSRDLARQAAEQAAVQFATTGGNEGAAMDAANTYVTSKNGELLQLQYHKSVSRWYEATVRVSPNTYVFKFVPILNRFLDQEATATVTF